MLSFKKILRYYINKKICLRSINENTLDRNLYRIVIPSDNQDLLVGNILKRRYYVLAVLGSGGMSIVYRVKDFADNTFKAVKALRMLGETDELIIKRFQREAETLYKLNHPGIVQVYDYGTSRKNQPYFVMDILDGETLEQLLSKSGRLKPKFVRDIFLQVCDALDHAHDLGIIHRDLKPANIILLYNNDNSKYQVKVFDFGIARIREDANKLTRMGEVWGSPIYMSPEQCMGTELDATSDIYSIATVMYECLTGEVPYLGKNFAATMAMKFKDPVLLPSTVCVENNISPELDALIVRGLAKIPHDRQENMAEFINELKLAIPLKTYKESFIPYRVLKKSTNNLQPVKPLTKFQRNKRLLILVVMLAILTLGFWLLH